MRVRNQEIRRRRHRKEQVQKARRHAAIEAAAQAKRQPAPPKPRR